MVLSSTLTDIGFVDAAVVALLGYAVVFFGLVLLMIVVIGMGKIFIAKSIRSLNLHSPKTSPSIIRTSHYSVMTLTLHGLSAPLLLRAGHNGSHHRDQ